mmetsp:Transcript_35928/g.58082  ORF Transcript_35928/g.58082 Transcript_35928/m.58082 type:complete len:704 (-) Transcript_35928:587-2698(-)|eukprot:CAMPEP_0184643246 /NCGR_PEP_ID=MMETSP0308-20130426/54_1 /TAXON_ID=38269 /ORGANISM="Gloeochaete witrockiana, Strain SAG 46.84" /LENGTH=703 /DNA_ID=CAMNT_0027071031 /DNA_START=63 /DNA_END=2174 /DNA_ORIENTATION=+
MADEKKPNEASEIISDEKKPIEEKPRPPTKRIPRPSHEDFTKKVTAINASIKTCRERLDEIKGLLDSRQGSKEAYEASRSTMIMKLKEIQDVTKVLITERNSLREQLNNIKEPRMEGGRAAFLKKGRPMTSEEINQEVRELEFQLATSSLTVKEEKEVMAKVALLKAKEDRQTLFDKVKAKETEIDKSKEVENAERQVLEKLREEYFRQFEQVPTLIAERDRLRAFVSTLRDQLTQVKVLYNKELEAWRENDNIMRQLEWKDKQEKYEKQKLERVEFAKQKDEERKARVEEYNRHNPYEEDLGLIDNLCLYLQSSVPKASPDTDLSSSQAAATSVSAASDSKGYFKRKGEEEDLGWFAGTAGKKGKKGSGSKPSTPPSALKGDKQAGAPKSDKLVHALDKFLAFERFKITAPLLIADIPATLDKLAVKKEEFKKREAVWKETIAKGGHYVRQEEDSAAAAPAPKDKAPKTDVTVVRIEEFPSLDVATGRVKKVTPEPAEIEPVEGDAGFKTNEEEIEAVESSAEAEKAAENAAEADKAMAEAETVLRAIEDDVRAEEETVLATPAEDVIPPVDEDVVPPVEEDEVPPVESHAEAPVEEAPVEDVPDAEDDEEEENDDEEISHPEAETIAVTETIAIEADTAASEPAVSETPSVATASPEEPVDAVAADAIAAAVIDQDQVIADALEDSVLEEVPETVKTEAAP